MNCPHCQHPLIGATESDFFLCVFDAQAFVLSSETGELMVLKSPNETIKQAMQFVCVDKKVFAAKLFNQEQTVSRISVRASLKALSEMIQDAAACPEHEKSVSLQMHLVMFWIMAVLSLVSFWAVVKLSWLFIFPALIFFLLMYAGQSIYRRIRKIKMKRSSGGTLLRGVIRAYVQIGNDKTGTGKFLACAVAVQLPDEQEESVHMQLIHVAQNASFNSSDAWVMRWRGGEKLFFDFPMKKF